MANDQLPKLAILGGTGDQGSGLALRWALAGYPVTIGSRSAERVSKHVNSLNEQYKTIKMVGDSNRGAAASAEMVILTVPFKVQRTTVVEVRDLLDNKILIDVTVPLVPPGVARAQLPVGGSAVAGIQELLGQSVKVVSAFQNVSAEHLQHVDEPIDCDVLVCGDDVEAREAVIKLAADGGMRGIHAGPLSNSVVAEALTSVLIGINKRYKVHGAGISITGLPGPVEDCR